MGRWVYAIVAIRSSPLHCDGVIEDSYIIHLRRKGGAQGGHAPPPPEAGGAATAPGIFDDPQKNDCKVCWKGNNFDDYIAFRLMRSTPAWRFLIMRLGMGMPPPPPPIPANLFGFFNLYFVLLRLDFHHMQMYEKNAILIHEFSKIPRFAPPPPPPVEKSRLRQWYHRLCWSGESCVEVLRMEGWARFHKRVIAMTVLNSAHFLWSAKRT